MHDDRLEELLAQAREPEPSDDGFTDGVMQRLRATSRGGLVRRFVGRPVLIAAAAVLVGGGALAAVGVSVTSDADVAASAGPRTTASAGAGASLGSRGLEIPVSDGSPAAQDRSPETTARPQRTAFHRGGAEYGYESDHTAYAEHEGIRLVTETFGNEARVDTPLEVRLTLMNKTDRTVYVTSEGRCPLVVVAHEGGGRDTAKVYDCAPESGPRPASSPPDDKTSGEQVALRPGESLVERSWVAFPKPGRWDVSGMCRCTVHPTKETAVRPSGDPSETAPPAPTKEPSRPTTYPFETAPPERSPQPTTRPTKPPTFDRTAMKLITPPIRIRVA